MPVKVDKLLQEVLECISLHRKLSFWTLANASFIQQLRLIQPLVAVTWRAGVVSAAAGVHVGQVCSGELYLRNNNSQLPVSSVLSVSASPRVRLYSCNTACEHAHLRVFNSSYLIIKWPPGAQARFSCACAQPLKFPTKWLLWHTFKLMTNPVELSSKWKTCINWVQVIRQ